MPEPDDIDRELSDFGVRWRASLPPVADPHRAFLAQASVRRHPALLSLASSAIVLLVVAAVAFVFVYHGQLPVGVASPSALVAVADSPSPSPSVSLPPASTPPGNTPSASPSARPLPGAMGQFEWQQIASGDGISALWAPDGRHVAIQIPGGIEVFDASGNSVGTAAGVRDPFWLTASTVEAYNASAFPQTSPTGDGISDFEMVAGIAIDVGNPTPVPVTVPCCYPLANGAGAVALTRYLPPADSGLVRPQYVVWQNGQESETRDGMPVGWDLAGDKLVVSHPTVAAFDPMGWLEVVSWPDGATLFVSDQNEAVPFNGSEFDSSGAYLAYPYFYRDNSGVWQHQVKIADLTSGAVSGVIAGGGDGFTWNGDGQIMALSNGGLNDGTFTTDGTKVDQQKLPVPTGFTGSGDYATLVSHQVDSNEDLTNLVAYRDGTSAELKPPSPVHHLYISPDGLSIVITVGSPSGEDAYLASVSQ